MLQDQLTRPVFVSPVTLKMRFNPYSSDPAAEAHPGALPPQVDPRQMSLLGAGWTAGSFKYLAEAGAESITYYETSGWRGVLETERGSALPKIFQSFPGSVYPLYHVLADIGEFANGQLIPIQATQPLRVDGFLLRQEGRERMILASFLPVMQRVKVWGLASPVRVRFLDETNVLAAMKSPETYRVQPVHPLEQKKGCLELDLLPYAIATIDIEFV